LSPAQVSSHGAAAGILMWINRSVRMLRNLSVAARHGETLRLSHRRLARNLSALPTTLTDDSAIAAAAMIGDSRMPKLG
jgi:hypothetical protein